MSEFQWIFSNGLQNAFLFPTHLCIPIVGCGAGDQPGHHPCPGERAEEAVTHVARGPGALPVGRLPGRHLRGHPAPRRLPYLWQQGSRDHRGAEEESGHCCACGAEEVRRLALSLAHTHTHTHNITHTDTHTPSHTYTLSWVVSCAPQQTAHGPSSSR